MKYCFALGTWETPRINCGASIIDTIVLIACCTVQYCITIKVRTINDASKRAVLVLSKAEKTQAIIST